MSRLKTSANTSASSLLIFSRSGSCISIQRRAALALGSQFLANCTSIGRSSSFEYARQRRFGPSIQRIHGLAFDAYEAFLSDSSSIGDRLRRLAAAASDARERATAHWSSRWHSVMFMTLLAFKSCRPRRSFRTRTCRCGRTTARPHRRARPPRRRSSAVKLSLIAPVHVPVELERHVVRSDAGRRGVVEQEVVEDEPGRDRLARRRVHAQLMRDQIRVRDEVLAGDFALPPCAPVGESGQQPVERFVLGASPGSSPSKNA